MSTRIDEITYRCDNDCCFNGCPTHTAKLTWNSCSDSYFFEINGQEMYFERGAIEAMLELLRRIGRVDCVQVN